MKYTIDSELNYDQAKHLVAIEPTREQAMSYIGILLDRGQINLTISAQLKIFVDGKFAV